MAQGRSGDTASDLSRLSPYEVYPFASYIQQRSGGEPFKRHATLAHAKSAISGFQMTGRNLNNTTIPSKIYRWVGNLEAGRWEEIEL